MTYPMLQLVASPDAGATVLFDFHDKTASPPRRFKREGFTLGSPALDGLVDAIDPVYTDRTIEFTLQVVGAESQVRAMHRLLARQLLASPGWLRWQPNLLTRPIWFQTWRPELDALSFDNFAADETENVWHLPIKIPAEPFAVGAWETLAAQTIKNNVAATPNPCFAVLPTIKGDAPAPARIKLGYTAAQTGRRHMLACSVVPSTVTAPIVWQIGTSDGWIAAADAPVLSSATWSGGSCRNVTFATTPPLSIRVSGPAPATIPVGRYKVLVRAARSDADSTFNMRFGVATGYSYIYGPTAPLTWNTSGTDHAAWVDVGEYLMPQGNPFRAAAGVVEPPVRPDISIQAGRLSGTGNLRLDAIMLVPITDEHATVLFADYIDVAPASFVHDEYHDAELAQIYIRDATLSTPQPLVAMFPPGIYGAFPVLVPGERNVLHFVEQTSTTRARTVFGATDCPDRLATEVSVNIMYRPRYLHAGEDL